MKATQLSYVLLCTLASASFMQGRTACPSPATVVLPQASCSSNVVLISQADVGPAGYVITLPGRYCLTEDITFSPLASGTAAAPVAAITIGDPSNVQLDLNGYTLSGPTTATINTVGVRVNSPTTPISNIIVENGSVQNFTVGVYVTGFVNNLLLQDLVLTGNGVSGSVQGGISPDTVTPFLAAGGLAILGGVTNFVDNYIATLNNITLQRVNASNNGGTSVSNVATYGALISGVNGVNILNSQFNFNTSVLNASYGLYVGQFNALNVIDSQGSNNGGVIQAVGMAFVGSLDADFSARSFQLFAERCVATDNYTIGFEPATVPFNVILAAGVLVGNVLFITFNDSQASDNAPYNTGTLTVPVRGSGFEMYAADRAIGNNLLAEGNSTYGFHLNIQASSLINNWASFNGSDGFRIELYRNEPLAVTPNRHTSEVSLLECQSVVNFGNGFYLEDSQFGVIENCIANENFGDGIFINQVTECISIDNIVKYNQLIANIRYGIQDTSHGVTGVGASGPANAYIGNQAFDNGTANYDTGVYAAGGAAPGVDTIPYMGLWFIPGAPPALTTPLTNLDMRRANCTVT